MNQRLEKDSLFYYKKHANLLCGNFRNINLQFVIAYDWLKGRNKYDYFIQKHPNKFIFITDILSS